MLMFNAWGHTHKHTDRNTRTHTPEQFNNCSQGTLTGRVNVAAANILNKQQQQQQDGRKQRREDGDGSGWLDDVKEGGEAEWGSLVGL